jgi:hypothetical protein
MIQMDGVHREVFTKLVDTQKVHDMITQSDGALVDIHSNGERSAVRISMAGFGLRRIRVANLPPGLSNHVIQVALTRFGEVRAIQD